MDDYLYKLHRMYSDDLRVGDYVYVARTSARIIRNNSTALAKIKIEKSDIINLKLGATSIKKICPSANALQIFKIIQITTYDLKCKVIVFKNSGEKIEWKK